MHQVANIRVGKPDTTPSKSAHVDGVKEGNRIHRARETGIYPVGLGARANARRSTSINPQKRNPIDPRSPNLSPA